MKREPAELLLKTKTPCREATALLLPKCSYSSTMHAILEPSSSRNKSLVLDRTRDHRHLTREDFASHFLRAAVSAAVTAASVHVRASRTRSVTS